MTELSKEEKKQQRREQHQKLLQERRKEAGLVRKIVFSLLVLMILVAAAVAFGSYQYVMASLGPVDEEEPEQVEVEIPIGSGTDTIAGVLEENGVISSSTMFRYYVRFQNESGFQAGTYQLSTAMSVDDIIEELKEGSVQEEYALSFTIPEGFWAEEIFARAADESGLEVEELIGTARDEDYLNELIEQYDMLTEEILDEDLREPLEGYLFPARYDFLEETPQPEEIIETMLDRMQAELNAALTGESDYTIHELLTAASIIEGEAQNDEERPMISGVIENRMRVPMPLQMDPTVSYAHGERLSRTFNEDTEIESPYNTYNQTGLPAGPINNPGVASIQAVENPEEHSYLYFYHSPEGDIYFNETYEQHQQTVGQYQ
ncbi:endolytic transglycosylase MltG [Bacillus daqingensis]|uniref:Endolytic murein transglycosylase n=1 Tax=Bacillus daqingensis TaxID=872396 RepID=A0ABV9NZB0_9BACI